MVHMAAICCRETFFEAHSLTYGSFLNATSFLPIFGQYTETFIS
jgi:hypothetical protein